MQIFYTEKLSILFCNKVNSNLFPKDFFANLKINMLQVTCSLYEIVSLKFITCFCGDLWVPV